MTAFRLQSVLQIFVASLIAFAAPFTSANEAGKPLLFRVSKDAMVILAPKSIKRVAVEENTEEGWVPLLVKHLNVTPRRGDFLSVRLPRVIAKPKLRVLGFTTDRFEPSDVDGATNFEEELVTSSSGGPLTGSGYVSINGGVNLTTSMATSNTLTLSGVGQPQRDTSVVVESDIWKIVGTKLYFFNQYRGLQAFDLSDPLHPQKTGTMRLAASGEQFYALDAEGSRLALLGRSSTGGRSVPVLYVVNVVDGRPTLDTKLDLGGAYVIDSRLVGDRLYALIKDQDIYSGYPTYSYTPGEIRLATVGLDGTPSILDSATVGSGNLWYGSQALQIDGGKLLVSIAKVQGETSFWGITQSSIGVFDIGSSSGVPVLEKTLAPKGYVSDKFKMAVMNGHLAVTSVTESYGNFATASSQTWVEMFALSGNDTDAIGSVELVSARGERLYATRYDANRAYVVTFRNTDPLFIVDLSVPAAPEVKGELVIPGWSTYLQPHGDRLISVGVEDWKVAVSLFDVSNPASPSLLSRVYPGAAGYYSWSEANYDEKAVEYDAAQSLLAVPFQSWTSTGYVSAIQQITVSRDSLTLGAAVEHGNNSARRGNIINGHFVSISGQQLIVSDALTATTEAQLTLAWRVDQVYPVGNFLAQIEQGPIPSSNYGWFLRSLFFGPASKPMLRISQKADPDALASELSLGAEAILGVSVSGSRIFLAQIVAINADTFLRTRIIDVAADGTAMQSAMIDQKIDPEIASSLDQNKVTALWPSGSTLAWLTPIDTFRWTLWYWGGPIYITSAPIIVQSTALTTVRDAGKTLSVAAKESAKTRQAIAHICTVVVATTNSPVAGKNRIIRGGEVSPDTIGEAFASAGFVMFGYHDERIIQRGNDTHTQRNWWLQALDLRDDTRIIARNRTRLPAKLISINQVDAQGAILLTGASTWNYQRLSYETTITANAYDGVDAFELDRWESASAQGSYTLFTADSTRAFVAEANPIDPSTSIASTITFDPLSKKLSKTGSMALSGSVGQYTLNAASGLLFASRYGFLETAVIGPDGTLLSPKTYEAPSNLWLPVDRATADDNSIYVPALDYGVELLER